MYLLSIIWVSLGLQYRVWQQYRGDALAGSVTVLFEQLVTLVTLGVVFANVPQVAGWQFAELLMLYGFTRVSLGVADAVTENLWYVGAYAQDGRLVLYLTRPVAVLVQLTAERIHFERLAHSVLGVVLIVYGAARLGHVWRVMDVLMGGYFVLLGVLIYLGLMVAGSALSVLVVGSSASVQLLWSLSEFAKYPVTIFGRVLTVVLCTLLPLGLIGFAHAALLLRPSPGLTALRVTLLSTGVTAGFLLACLALWRLALRRYEGTGT